MSVVCAVALPREHCMLSCASWLYSMQCASNTAGGAVALGLKAAFSCWGELQLAGAMGMCWFAFI